MHRSFHYKVYRHGNMIISTCSRASCLYLEGRVVVVRNIVLFIREIHVLYEVFETGTAFFKYPIDSKTMGVHLLSKLSGQLAIAPVAKFTKPIIFLPLRLL